MSSTDETHSEKPTACVDLDGVLNTYDGWQGPRFFHGPQPGARDFLLNLGVDYKVVVQTTRDVELTRDWLRAHQLYALVDDVVNVKPPAVVYIDDRAVRFEGDYDAVLQEVRVFGPWWISGEDQSGEEAPEA